MNTIDRFVQTLRLRFANKKKLSLQEFEREFSSLKEETAREIRLQLSAGLTVLKDKTQVSRFVAPVLSGFASMSGSIEREFTSLIRRGVNLDLPSNQIRDEVEQALGVVSWKARTLSETATGGLTRAKKMSDDLATGIARWRFVGPSPDRDFCVEHIGKTYTIDEIRSMDNGQGLPVEFFCGGYNCRHRWIAVVDGPREVPSPAPPRIAPPPPPPPVVPPPAVPVAPPPGPVPGPPPVKTPRTPRTPRKTTPPAASPVASPAAESDTIVVKELPITGGTLPEGVKVSGALPVEGGNKKRRAIAEELLKMIDSVHGDGELPTIPVKLIGASRGNNGSFNRSYDYARGGWYANHIRIRSSADTPHLTQAHEIGHFLDNAALSTTAGGVKSYGSLNNPLLEGWREAIAKSDQISQYASYRKRLDDPNDEEMKGLSWHRKQELRGHIDYLTSNEELFARSYSQYIAYKTQDPNLLGDVKRWRTGSSNTHYLDTIRQWDDRDFLPIAKAFDELFKAKKWIKEGNWTFNERDLTWTRKKN